MKKYLKLLLGISCVTVISSSYADVTTMQKIYNNPQTAAKVQKCKGNQNCNAFYALSQQWQSIPNNFKIGSFKIKNYAREGDGYGLVKGFSPPSSDRGYDIFEARETVFYRGGAASKTDERTFAQGLAVLLYLDNKN